MDVILKNKIWQFIPVKHRTVFDLLTCKYKYKKNVYLVLPGETRLLDNQFTAGWNELAHWPHSLRPSVKSSPVSCAKLSWIIRFYHIQEISKLWKFKIDVIIVVIDACHVQIMSWNYIHWCKNTQMLALVNSESGTHLHAG
jgi:hypothetical protein